MINEIQPKIKFQNIVQCPFNEMSIKEWRVRAHPHIKAAIETKATEQTER